MLTKHSQQIFQLCVLNCFCECVVSYSFIVIVTYVNLWVMVDFSMWWLFCFPISIEQEAVTFLAYPVLWNYCCCEIWNFFTWIYAKVSSLSTDCCQNCQKFSQFMFFGLLVTYSCHDFMYLLFRPTGHSCNFFFFNILSWL